MPVPAGTRLGPYEIVAPLGAGGMGEVYRGRDPRLGREVAIKILPATFARDPDRLRRFEQEARAAGALNHPNILAVFDVGSDGTTQYLVTELLDGVTLRDRLRSGPLPARKATEYAVQIARGLAAAHDRGIVHRDLKPENIFISRDGHIKILDFGLAKLTTATPSEATLTSAGEHLTAAGVVMGSAGYMSPEQIRGEKVDHRSDLFSFGAVLYEMVSGQKAFTGPSAADVASAILHREPPELPDTGYKASPALDRLIRHCLEKRPDERFQSARDLGFQLDSLSVSSDSGSAAAAAAARKHIPLRAIWWLAACLAVLASASLAWFIRGNLQPGYRQVEFRKLTDFAGMEETPTLSPDGKSVAFVCDSTGSRQIWIRLLAGGAPLQITHDAGDHLEPRWSRDSASLIYYTLPPEGNAQGTLWEVSALGGSARRIASSLSGADVSHDNKRLVFFRLNNGQYELVTSDRDGGDLRVISKFAITFSYRNPRWSPNDETIAYIHSLENWTDDVYTIPVAGGSPKPFTHDKILLSGLAWLPDGSGIVYSSGLGSTLLYLPTMHLWLEKTSGGEPRQLTFGEASDQNPDVDQDWHIVASRQRSQFNIWKFPVTGKPDDNVRHAVQITNQTGQVQTPTLSPDDRHLAYLSDTGGHGNIWVLDQDGGQSRQITYEKSMNAIIGVPIWSPDGKYITFARTEGATAGGRTVEYWLVHPDGSDLHQILAEGAWAAWSGDSHWLYYSESSPLRNTNSFRLMKVRVDGGDPVVVRTDNAKGPAVAPDGSALFYVVPLSNVNGSLNYELRVARPENATPKLLGTISGERVPLWQGLHPVISSDGKWLAMPLNDNVGTNIWLMSTADGSFRKLTDFGSKRTFIARRISWSSDNKWLYAALGEGDADIVMMNGLLK